MLSSTCLCSPRKKLRFDEIIRYERETVFKRFEGTVIGKCSSCGVLKTFPSSENAAYDPVQSRAAFYEDLAGTFKELFSRTAETIGSFKRTGTVLDVGCSSGLLMEVLEERGYKVQGIEPNESAYEIARSKFGNRVSWGTMRDFVSRHTERFDIIIYNHVMEHVPDPLAELGYARSMLGDEGILVLGLPNTENIIFRVRGKYWEPLMPNEHIWHFGKSYLRTMLKDHGFNVRGMSFENDRRLDYPFLKRVYFGLLSFMNTCLGTGEAMLVIASKNT